MRFRYVAILIALLALALGGSASISLAQVGGGNFDGIPVGPYPFGPPNAVITSGDPGAVTVQPAGSEGGGAPPVPHGAGNVLCINALGGGPPIVVTFTFACVVTPGGACFVKYDWSGAAWSPGAGLIVYQDGHSNNPSDVWQPPVGLPPTTASGDNSESAGECDGSSHTITFVVMPQSRIYIDNLRCECIVVTPGIEPLRWDLIKDLYW